MLGLIARPLLLLVAAAALGFACNALRSRDHLELGHVYFAASGTPAPANGTPALPPSGTPAAPNLAARAAAEFAIADADNVQRLVAAADFDASRAVFIDARDEKHYRSGHLPGALAIDYFNLKADIAPSLFWLQHCVLRPPGQEAAPPPSAPAADWITRPRALPLLLVYCDSDECEDGFSTCRALRDDFGIEADRIVLYLGGMRDWRARRWTLVRGGPLW